MNQKSIFRTEDGKNYTLTFILISSLFLLWGFCNGMIDVMDKHFQDHLHLSKSQSAWVQVAHYMGYCFMSLPAGWLARRLGYKGGLVSGLLIVAVGGFWFIPATQIASLWAFLLGVFILAMGLTFLETIANPYTTVLGHPHYAAARINLAQSCNGIGWILGPIVGGLFFYSSDGAEAASKTLYIPYLAVALIVLVMAAVFYFATIPELQVENAYAVEEQAGGAPKSIWSHPHFIGAVMAQFFYVAAQAGIFSFFINYIVAEIPPVGAEVASSWLLSGGTVLRDGAMFINEKGATVLLGYVGFVLFLLGRFSGSLILRKAEAHTVLGVYGVINAVLMLIIFLKIGWLSVGALFLSFFFMSIMFPTIFALGIFGLGEQAKKASSFIVMAIMGGAVMPKLMGWVGDHYDMSRGFIVPLFCFAFLALYSFYWPQLSKSRGMRGLAVTGRGH